MRPPAKRRASAVAAALLLAGACAPVPDTRPPDVLLVVLDTVRADHLSLYGYGRRTDARLSALAELGVTFEDVTAPAPWTWPSHASLFTGEPPWVHGAHLAREEAAVERFGIGVTPLRADLPTLAERFAREGYRTEALVVNDWLHPSLGLMRGFERAQHFDRDAALIGAASGVIGRDAGDTRPLLLFVNVMTAHSPFREGPGEWALDDRSFLDPATAPPWVQPYLVREAPPGVHLAQAAGGDGPTGVMRHAAGELEIPPQDLERLRRLYDASVRGADFVLGRVLEAWIGAGREGVVAVTSDHGEGFGEHGMLDHRASVYPEVLRVPLVIAAPGRLPAGARFEAPVSLLSLHDTLLDLAGIGGDAARSLVPRVRGRPRDEAIAAAAWPDPAWAMHAGGRFERGWRLYRRGDEALVYAADPAPHGAEPAEAELYDLASDPGMRIDLAAHRPDRVAALRAAAASHFGDPRPPAPAMQIPEPTAARLRALGYAAGAAGL